MEPSFPGKDIMEKMTGARVGVIALLITGCATVAPPRDRIAAAEMQIRKAEDGLAAQYAPLDLLKAREKYEGARRAVQQEEFDEARRLADQATVDARLAEEKARTAKAQRMAEEMQESLETLQRETERYAPRERSGSDAGEGALR